MKKNIGIVVLLLICTANLRAQTCSPAGFDQFYPLKTSMRVGLFTPPNDHIDSIGCYAIAFGLETRPKGYGSVAMGNNSVTTGDYSFASGSYAIASGQNSIATGFNTLASGAHSAGFGYRSQASGLQAFATGYYSLAAGYASTAIGSQTQANSDASFAGGSNTIAGGLRSFAFGSGTRALGYESISIGSYNVSTGVNAFTLGYFSKASGDYSFAVGSYADSRAPTSIAMGNGTMAKAINGTALGYYNDSTDNPNPLAYGSADRIFQIGNGNFSTRNNALTILRNGNMGIGVLNPAQKLEVSGNIAATGNVTVQSKGIIRSSDATQQKKLVTNVAVNTTFTAGQTKTFTVTWPESFGAAPDAFIGNIVSGAGGWAEVVMTISTTTTTGGTLYVYNPRTTSVSPNFTVKVVAIGAQ